MELTTEELRDLKEAYLYALKLSEADSVENMSGCCVFHIDPFHSHWDKATVQEINKAVKLYVDTWILPHFERGLKVDRKAHKDHMMLNWYKQQVRKLEHQLKAKEDV